jgi:hypothetical protein
MGDIYQQLLFSRDRLPGSTSAVNFRVLTYPKHVVYTKLNLKSCSIPFTFHNITTTYGDTLILRVTPDTTLPGIFYDLVLVFGGQYLTIPQLIAELNFKIGQEIVAQSIPVIFSLSLSAINNKLQINSNSLLSKYDFFLPADNRTYLYNMLGLSTSTTTSFDFTATTTYFQVLPYSFTDDLPFGYIFIHIDPIPTYTYTTGTSSGHFIVPTSGYRPYVTEGTSVLNNTPLQYENLITFDQEIEINRTPEKIQTLQIRLTDEKNNDITEHAGNKEWSMLLGVEGINTYRSQ